MEITEDFEDVRKLLSRKSLAAAKKKGGSDTWAQIMRKGDEVNLFLDLDDRVATLEEAEAWTAELVGWSQTELPKLVKQVVPNWDDDVNNIQISVMPGEDPDWSVDSVADLLAAAEARIDDTAKLEDLKEHFKKMARSNPALFEEYLDEAGVAPTALKYKASVHVCVTGTVLEWCSTTQFLEQKLDDGTCLLDKFPRCATVSLDIIIFF